MSTFCSKLKSPATNIEKLKQEVKKNFPGVFSGGLGKSTKIIAQFQIKDIDQPILKKKEKRNDTFAALEQINEELNRLERAGILSKTDFSEWAGPTVYVRKNLIKLGFAPIFQQG